MRVRVSLLQVCTCHFMLKEETRRLVGSRSKMTILADGSSCAARSAAFG